MAFSNLIKTTCRLSVTLAGRNFLPGANGKGFPKYLAEPRKGYPYIIEPQDFGISPGASPYECAELLK